MSEQEDKENLALVLRMKKQGKTDSEVYRELYKRRMVKNMTEVNVVIERVKRENER